MVVASSGRTFRVHRLVLAPSALCGPSTAHRHVGIMVSAKFALSALEGSDIPTPFAVVLDVLASRV